MAKKKDDFDFDNKHQTGLMFTDEQCEIMVDVLRFYGLKKQDLNVQRRVKVSNLRQVFEDALKEATDAD